MSIKTQIEDTCIDMKSAENRKCASCCSGEHDFENGIFEPRSCPHSFFSARSALASVKEKRTKARLMGGLGRPGGRHGGAGGDLRGVRSADFRFAITDLCFRFDTPALAIRQGRRIQALRAFRRARLKPEMVKKY